MRPHIDDADSPIARQAFREFLRALERGDGPRNAVMRANAAGAAVSAEWIRENYCPIHATIATLEARGDVRGAIAYRAHNLESWTHEKAALDLCRARASWAEQTSDDDDERRKAQEAARQRDRAGFIVQRGAQLYEASLAATRAAFCREAADEFDALHPPHVMPAPPPAPASVVALAPAAAKRARKPTNNEPPTAA